MAYEDRFFGLLNITQDRFSDIFFCIEHADNIILDLKGLTDQKAQLRQKFGFLGPRARQEGANDQRAVKGITRRLERIVEKDIVF